MGTKTSKGATMNTITPEMYRAVEQQRDEARAELAKYKDAIQEAIKANNHIIREHPENAELATAAIVSLDFVDLFVKLKNTPPE